MHEWILKHYRPYPLLCKWIWLCNGPSLLYLSLPSLCILQICSKRPHNSLDNWGEKQMEGKSVPLVDGIPQMHLIRIKAKQFLVKQSLHSLQQLGKINHHISQPGTRSTEGRTFSHFKNCSGFCDSTYLLILAAEPIYFQLTHSEPQVAKVIAEFSHWRKCLSPFSS